MYTSEEPKFKCHGTSSDYSHLMVIVIIKYMYRDTSNC